MVLRQQNFSHFWATSTPFLTNPLFYSLQLLGAIWTLVVLQSAVFAFGVWKWLYSRWLMHCCFHLPKASDEKSRLKCRTTSDAFALEGILAIIAPRSWGPTFSIKCNKVFFFKKELVLQIKKKKNPTNLHEVLADSLVLNIPRHRTQMAETYSLNAKNEGHTASIFSVPIDAWLPWILVPVDACANLFKKTAIYHFV